MTFWRWLAVAAVLLAPHSATAQTTKAPRWEVTGGAGWLSGAGVGTSDANLRANSTTPQPFTLFTTQSDFAGSLLGEGRVSFALTPRIAVEGRLGFNRPSLETSVSSDAEGAAPITVVERVDQYIVDVGVVVRIDEMRLGGLVPYAAGGAGYLRQLHEGLAVIEQGHVYHLGGGVKRNVLSRNHGFVRAAGLRADARAYLLSGGVSLNDCAAWHGSFTAGVFVGF